MEDVKMSICGSAVGVERIDLLDEKGESLFCPSDIKYPFDNYKPEPQISMDSEPFLRRKREIYLRTPAETGAVFFTDSLTRL
ncbi:hypothetical protein D915_009403 [Fasciola hepatica]|uniref:Uncharacterized protein n=1 Tax=Fasciola hepatica TaxID=6192 RepID=A0A4E0QXB4_FASHE|nr:hypothetical protein D915_009403 [Fasciola hepatica]